MGESQTCIISLIITHTHGLGSGGASSGSIMTESENVRKCQKISENIKKNIRTTHSIVTSVTQRVHTLLPFTMLNHPTCITNFCTLIDKFCRHYKGDWLTRYWPNIMFVFDTNCSPACSAFSSKTFPPFSQDFRKYICNTTVSVCEVSLLSVLCRCARQFFFFITFSILLFLLYFRFLFFLFCCEYLCEALSLSLSSQVRVICTFVRDWLVICTLMCDSCMICTCFGKWLITYDTHTLHSRHGLKFTRHGHKTTRRISTTH